MEHKSQSFNAIDLTKFICAFWVIVIHVEPFGPDPSGVSSFFSLLTEHYLARLAVPFFFITSGFLLFYKMSPDSFSMERPIRYAKRIFRIYLIWSVIYIPLAVRKLLREEDGSPLKLLVIYLRNFIFKGSHTQLWYLPALIFAVLLVSVLLMLKIKPIAILVGSAIFYIIGLFGQSWFGFVEPLEEHVPGIWSVLEHIMSVIVTTRDGLFDGFFFVAAGMCFAFCEIRIEKKKAQIGLVISMILLFVEAFLLEYFDIQKERNMYLFLMPASVLIFALIYRVNLKDKPIYKTLRVLSALIFYLHMWVDFFVRRFLELWSRELADSVLRFLLVAIGSVLLALLLYKMSEYEKLKWMKKIYA
ncbi:MAG: acyltransferase [Eubacterium sp.]|nr:acyltransferase [Eubacterium sp.]